MKKTGFLILTTLLLLNLILGLFFSINLNGLARVNAQETPTLTVNIEGNGQVNPNSTAPYVYGDVIELTATADLGWSFESWSGDLTGSVNPETITMDSNKTVTATFTQDEYTLTVNTNGNGQVNPNSTGPYVYGDAVELTAVADSGWEFDGWTGDLGGDVNPETIIMDGNKTVTATFTEIPPTMYNLTIIVDGSGTTDPVAGVYSYEEDTGVDITAIPDSGMMLDHWILDGGDVGSANPYTVTVDSNHTLTAVFTKLPPKKHVLTVNMSGSGITDPPEGTHSYVEGTDVDVTATADAGWMFDHWILDTVDAGTTNPYTVIMDADHDLTAVFIDITPPTIEIISPQNTIYSTTSVDLTFTVNEETSWIAYSLDDQNNITISDDTILSGLSEGFHSVVIFANDTSDNTGKSNVVYFSVDTTPPTITILSPGSTTYSTSQISLRFTVSEEASWIGYSLDDQNNITISGNTTISIASEGAHKVVVYANDTVGKMGKSNTIYFSIYFPPIDTTPPTITITSPQETNYSTTDVALTFTIDESVLWTAYSLDDEDNVTITGNTALSDLSEGEHTIKIFATDTAGNTGSSNLVTFKVDTTPPTINLTSPEETTYSTASVFLEFTINEETTWIGYSLDEEDNVTITGDSMLSGLSEGSHSIIVFATDYAGNTGASSTVQFTISIPPVDTTLPTIKINSPQNSTYPPPTVDLNFNINEQASWIAYSLDGNDNVTISGNTTISEMSEGLHNIVVFATDTAGNTGASSVVQFTISIPPVDTTPPTIVITSPENTTISGSTIVLDFAINEEVTWIGYNLDGQDNVTITGDTVLSSLTEGSHKITVFATDPADNTGASDTIQFTISIPPADTTPPTITINSPQNTTYEVSEIPLNFSVNEDTSWIGFSLDDQNNITISENIILSGLAEGSHSIVVFANDTAGNIGASDTVRFVVTITSEDTTPPTITINSPENTKYNTDEITLTFTVNEEPSLKYYSLDGKANVTVVDSTVLSDISVGEHSLIMYAEDSAGNIAASEVITFTIVTKSDQGAQLWIVGIIGIVAFTGFMFSAYIAYDLYKSSRS